MRHIEIEAAEEIFESLVDEVEQGAMLTRDGIVVARMIPFKGETLKGGAIPPQT